MFNSFPVIRTASAKNRRLHVLQHTFLFLLETPLRVWRKMLHRWKDNSMLVKRFAACTFYLQQFPSNTMLKSMRKSKNRYFYHIFVSPGDAPGAITLNVVWMESEFDAYKLSRSMYPSIFNNFPVIRTASAKNRRFHVLQPTFLFPLETPLRLWRKVLHRWKDNSMLVKRFAACTYLPSIVSSYTMLESMRESKNRHFYHILFPLGTPLAQSR